MRWPARSRHRCRSTPPGRATGPGRDVEAHRHLREEPLEHLIDPHAQNRILRSAHAGVGQIRRAPRAGSPRPPSARAYGSRPPRTPCRRGTAPCATFSDVASPCMSTRITVASRRTAGSTSSTARNGQSAGAMKTRPIRLTTATGSPDRRAGRTVHPTPGTSGAKFEGPEQPVVLLQIRDDLPALPDVIARREHVDAGVEQLLGAARVDPLARSRRSRRWRPRSRPLARDAGAATSRRERPAARAARRRPRETAVASLHRARSRSPASRGSPSP